jgi:hypothetical protein
MAYEITYDCNALGSINSSGISIECKNFQQILDKHPSDRHAYKLKLFTHPLSIGRLPIMAKNFLKFTRLA